MRKERKKYRSGTIEEVQKRNKAIINRYEKMIGTGKYGKMEIYQKLAVEFGFEERNSVYAIIKAEKEREKEVV